MSEELKQAVENLKQLIPSKRGLDKYQTEYVEKIEIDFKIVETELNESEQQNKILKEELDAVNDFRKHYKNHLEKIKNLTMANERLNYFSKHTDDEINTLHFRNNLLVERLEKQKAELNDLREFARIVVRKRVDVYSILMTVSCIEYNERISYYYPSLADKKYLKKLLLNEEEWQFLKKMMRNEEYGKKRRN